MRAGCEQRATVDAIDGWTPDESVMKEIDRVLAENISQPVGPEFLAGRTRQLSEIGAMNRRVQR
jgi:hypothetical protein